MNFNDIVSGFAPKPRNVKPQVKVHLDSIRLVLKSYVRSEVERLKRAIREDEMSIRILEARQTRSYMIYRHKNALDSHRAALQSLRSKWGSEEAIDRYLTGIYTLRQFTKIWGEERPRVPFSITDVPYIIGETTDVVIEHGGSRRLAAGKYSLGPYRIMVPLGGALHDIHWVPVRNPDAINRHPHHYLGNGGPRTCFGSFADIMQVTVEGAEIIQALRLMGEFCHRYNESSPLILVRDIPNLQRLNS